MIAPNVLCRDWGFRAVFRAGFGCDSEFLAQIVYSICEGSTVGRIVAIELGFVPTGDNKIGDLHGVDVDIERELCLISISVPSAFGHITYIFGGVVCVVQQPADIQ